MKNQKKVVWYRFKTRSVDDYRPLNDMKDIGMPWWFTGWAMDLSYAVIVCYLPEKESLSKYWNDAFDIQMEYRDEIVYTERLEKPEYLRGIGVSTTGVREMYLRHCPFCHSHLKQRLCLNIICDCGAKYYYNTQMWINRNRDIGVNVC